MSDELTLREGRWYGFQSLDGGLGAPFDATPMFVTAVEPLKTGKGLLRLSFVRLVAPIRAVAERQTVRVRYRTPALMLGELVDGTKTELLLIVPIKFRWLKQLQPRLTARFDSSWTFNDDEAQVEDYMAWYFGDSAAQIANATSIRAYNASRPLPEPTTSSNMPFKRRFADLDAWLLLRGLKPTSSDDKWFIHVDWDDPRSGTISVRRSWTGYLYWKLAFVVDGRSVLTTSALVSLDQQQRQFGTKEYEAQQLDGLLRAFLLGEPNALPSLTWEPKAPSERDDWN